ncbi:MAG: branched-chain amino acid ABC transporter substrate-binding protein [Chloroflexi bacterium]|nr:branched-chain amino acid ABC transporter substrate-binding protein [Chloroflexota bacterium]
MRNMKSLRFVFLIVVLALAVSPVYGQGDDGQVIVPPGETVKIALVTDLTGPIAPMGVDIQQAGELAVEEFNADGGVLGEWPIELVVEDDACSGDQATTVASRVVSDPEIVAVAGHSCSGATSAASDIYEDARLPMVSPSATATVLATRDLSVFNRTAPLDADQGVLDAHYLYKILGVRRLAVLHDNDTYGLGLAEVVQEAFIELGGEVVAFQGISVTDQDFRPVLTELVPEQPEAIFFGGYQQQAVLLVPQMADVGLEDVYFFGPDGIFAQAFIDGAGDAGEGVLASFPSLDVGDPERNADFDDLYYDTYGLYPEEQGPFHAQSYDATFVLMNAIEAVAEVDDDGNLVIDREALIEAVRTTTEYSGLTGSLTCDEFGNCGTSIFGVYYVQDGEWVEITGLEGLLEMEVE